MANTLSLKNRRVIVVGLGREGEAVSRFLAAQGAKVTLTDITSAEKLADRVARLAGLQIDLALGYHPTDLLNRQQTDFLVVSPGVPLDIPFLQAAQAAALPLTTESRLFCELCPAPIIGISGSSGKTTTTTLVGHMLTESGFKTYVGGNIGQPLISQVTAIQPQDSVVLELSSFQLEYFHPASADAPPGLESLFKAWSPDVGALLNITPNHLDRHKTMAAYTYAKESLVAYQTNRQIAVLGWDNPTTRQLGQQLPGQVQWFSRTNTTANAWLTGSANDQRVMLNHKGVATEVCPVSAIKLRGRHNQSNVLAASLIAAQMGATPAAIRQVATSFSGVPHRLQMVARRNGVTYINDSIATSPERLVAALNAFDQPLILLAGGKDKDLPWHEAAALMARKVKHLLLFGDAQDLIAAAFSEQDAEKITLKRCGSLTKAVKHAKTLAQPGDIVLLSPGGTSYDAYIDFAARGEHFAQLVNE